MKLEIFALRDIKTDQFGTPMFLTTKGQALRALSDEVNREDKDNNLNRHPEDFEYYSLGVWDSDTGIFDTRRPEQIAVASDYAIRKNGQE